MSKTSSANDRPFQRLLLRLISLYQSVLSPLLPGACRFHPSCSCYAHDAIETWGAARGIAMSAWRILRCNPFNDGGFDPVPERRKRGNGHSPA